MQKVHIGYRKLNTDILGIFLTYITLGPSFFLPNTLLTHAKEGKKKAKK